MRTISMTMIAVLATVATASAGGGDKGAKAPPPETTSQEMPSPPKELLDIAKSMKGTWSCKGTMNDPTGAGSNFAGTMKWSLDLDKMWLKGALTIKKRKGEKRGYKANFYRSYSNGTWSHLSVGNMGDWGAGTSTGPDADGKITFEGSANAGGMSWKTKDYEQKGEKKGTFHVWGEVSMDGKTFQPAYDMTCSK